MSDYANDRADNHINMMQSNRKSVSEFLLTDAEMVEIDNALKDRPLETKAIKEFKRSNTRQAIWTIASLTLLAIIVIFLSWR